MKTLVATLFSLSLALASFAQGPAPAPLSSEGSQLTPEQLEQLLGPIALYPDALIAIMLPAATAPADIVLAARYLRDGGDPNAVASRGWDESVQSLVHFADLVKWMDDNLAWTKQLGEAFRDQPAEVMQAIQRLRAKARAAGMLKDSPQQQVIADGDVIMIVPALADMLYVPYYDPALVYAPPPAFYGSTPFVTFGPSFAAGPWLVFDCDWRHRTVWQDDHDRGKPGHRDWRHPIFPGQPGYVNDPNRHPWRPTPSFAVGPKAGKDRLENIVRPVPFAPAPRPAMARNDTPNPRVDSPKQPPRTDDRNRDPNFNRPSPTWPASAAAPSPAPPIAVRPPPPDRGGISGQVRDDTVDRSNRPTAFPNAPRTLPTGNNPTPVAQSAPPPMSFPIAPAPASRVGPGFPGPVVAAPPPPPAPPPAAAPAPAAAPSDKGSGKDSDQKKQPN